MSTALPLVLVIDSPFECDKRKSYGIMLYSISTDRWLLVNARDSSSIVALCRGLYHPSRIPHLVEVMSREDVDRIVSASENFNDFERLCKEVDSHPIDYVIEYSYKRLVQSMGAIVAANRSRAEHDTRGWPKGKPLMSETTFVTALRELKEETSVDLSVVPFTNHGTVVKSYYTYCNLKYTDTYFVCSVTDEIPIGDCDTSEVSYAQWVNTRELGHLFVSEALSMIM